MSTVDCISEDLKMAGSEMTEDLDKVQALKTCETLAGIGN